MRSLFLALLFAVPVQAQTWVNEVNKRTGETITITWEYTDGESARLTAWNLYRQTGVSNSPSRVAIADITARSFQVLMPSGSTKQYRFLVRPVKGNTIGPAGTEVIVNRVQ